MNIQHVSTTPNFGGKIRVRGAQKAKESVYDIVKEKEYVKLLAEDNTVTFKVKPHLFNLFNRQKAFKLSISVRPDSNNILEYITNIFKTKSANLNRSYHHHGYFLQIVDEMSGYYIEKRLSGK